MGTKPKKRQYKLYIDADYSEDQVSDLTKSRWTNLYKRLKGGGSHLASADTIQSSSSAAIINYYDDENYSDKNNAHEVLDDSISTVNKIELNMEGKLIASSEDLTYNPADESETENINGALEEHQNFEILKNIMFIESQLTINDVILMIQAFALKFNLTQSGREELLNMIKIFAGEKFKSFNFSNYSFSKQFDPPNEIITNHYYCNLCSKCILKSTVENDKFRTQIVKCEICSNNLEINSSSEFVYTTVNIEHQLTQLISDKVVCEDLRKSFLYQNKTVNSTDHTNLISPMDIHDGFLYKKIINTDQNYITLNINIDGAQIFNSSKRAMWPMQAIINELTPVQRFRNTLLLGFWVTHTEPKADAMNLFLSSFLEEIEKFNKSGFEFLLDNNHKIIIQILPFCFCVDSVARPILQNRVQFNGYKGCSWCLHNGVYINGAVRYPLQEEDSETRTHEKHLEDIRNSLRINKYINGVKGNTVLANINPFFDMVWSFPLDYMHGVLLGITKHMWQLWACTPKQKFSISLTNRKLIDQKILSIKPPNEIHRLTRKMSDFKNFKASEWKSFLLFYSIPLLDGALDDEIIQHFALFVDSVYKLLKTNISKIDLDSAEYKLLKFVGEFEIIYGKEYSTFNVHSVLHLVESVKNTGPLWATSTFPFESAIHFFKQQINGPKGVGKQVVKKFLQIQTFKQNLQSVKCNIISMDYCKSLYFRGNSVDSELPGNCATVRCNFLGRENNVGHYKKCVLNRRVYYSAFYSKKEGHRDNTWVELISGEIVQIQYFFMEKDNYLMNVKIVSVCEEFKSKFNVLHIRKINETLLSVICKTFPISHIKSKCVFIDVCNNKYVCTFPNIFEIQ